MLGWLLAACAPGTLFAQDQAEALCAWRARCDSLGEAGFASEEDCVDQVLHGVSLREAAGQLACDGYDASAASACLAVYAEVACDAVPDFTVCEAVCADPPA